MKKAVGVVSVLCVSAATLCGQVRAEDVDLDKIVVTPSRVEQAYGDTSRKVEVVTAKEIEASGSDDVAEVLSTLTSVNVSNYGGLGASKTIRMRGSTAAQVLVSLDGRPMNNPRDGEVDLSNIPLDNIARIEVLHGPASSLYGTSAMGGMVNIITKDPPQEKRKAEVVSSFGTFRTYTQRLSLADRISDLGYILTGGYQTSRGLRDNSEFNAKDFNDKVEYVLNGNNKVTLNSGFYKSKTGAPGTLTSFDSDDKQQNLKHFVDFTWNFQPDTVTGLSTKLYQNYDRLEFIENTAGSIFDVAFNKDIHTTTSRGLDVQCNKSILDTYQVVTGVNYVGNFNDSTASAKHKYNVRAAYLENQWDVSKALRVNFGARVDDYSNFGTEVSPSFSFLYNFIEDVKLHGVVSESFRAPTFNDLYWPDQGWVKGNPNLKPEKGKTGELGIETKVYKNLTTDISYYRSAYDQLIQWGEEAGVWQPKNIGSSVSDGVEWENKIFLGAHYDLNLDYTYLRAKDDKTHRYLIYQPKHKIDSGFRYKDLKGLMVEVKGQFTDKRFHDPENTIKVKRYYVLGISASKKFERGVTLFGSVDNLLNRHYQVIRDYPLPGFAVTGGVKAEF
jgi:outer membrane cobalamin receptor